MAKGKSNTVNVYDTIIAKLSTTGGAISVCIMIFVAGAGTGAKIESYYKQREIEKTSFEYEMRLIEIQKQNSLLEVKLEENGKQK